MIRWREKLSAFGLHFLLTAAVALAAAALIFLVWFPAPFDEMVGGTRLFTLVVGCDLALGPLVSLVIYDSRKPRRTLVLDYAVVGILQLGALAYGIWVVADSRPVYVVFVGDRLEVVTAGEIEAQELEAATDPRHRRLPAWGIGLVAAVVPPAEHNEALFAALAGRDIHLRPRYFIDYDTARDRIRERAAPLALLEQRRPGAAALLDTARRRLHRDDTTLRWLPVRHRNGFWTALVDAGSGRPVDYLPLDPY
ncbi:MAG: hypothetical protein IT486_04525 [Gammaproteobacteria bacterium]|nr:hypothetical protein [Gammaproteobacteria bacterium]